MHVDFAGLCFTDEGGLPFSHDRFLVVLSFLLAVVGCYTALDLSDRQRQASRSMATVWRLAASATLGGSVWAMHFMSMLAWRIALPITYDLTLTVLSFLVAVLAAGVALQIIAGRNPIPWRIAAAGIILALGVLCMHYLGMAAIRLPGVVAYRPGLWALSLIIALVAAVMAVWIFYSFYCPRARLFAAIGMAVGVCGMHYVGMTATVVRFDPLMFMEISLGIDPEPLAVAIAVSASALLVLALFSSAADRRLSAATLREATVLRRANEDLRKSQQEIVARLCQANELRDDDTGYHCRRVSLVAYRIALAAGYGNEFAASIRDAAPLHDIGKIGIADAILLKRAKLDPEERAAMERHAEMGAEMLQGSNLPLLQLAAAIALSHHERWDGTGYPWGLSGTAIPLAARIIALADVFDALMTVRSYKLAWELDRTLQYMAEQAGRQFDPELVDAFLGDKDEIVAIWHRYADPPRSPQLSGGHASLGSRTSAEAEVGSTPQALVA